MSKKDLQHDSSVEKEILRRHQEMLINLTLRASEKVSLDDFLQEVVLRVSQAIEIDHVKLMRYRAERGDLFTEAGVGWKPGVVRTASFASDMGSLPGQAFQTGQPVQVESIQDEPGYRPSRVLEEHGIISVLNVPVLVDGAAWGVLEADSTVLRGFSPDTVSFMTGCAA